MSPEPWVRALAGAVAVAAATRGARPWALGLTGVSLAAAVAGTLPAAPPSPAEAGLGAGVWALAAALLFFRVWPPIVSAAARAGAFLCVPTAAFLLVPFREVAPSQALGVVGVALWAAAVLCAEGSRANAEAGWRRAAGWGLGVFASAGVAAGGVALLSAAPAGREGLVGGAALAAGVLAFVPAAVAEWRRVRRELEQEVALGFLPAEDAAVLAVPWRRLAEPRFGRSDERREFVRSALLLCVARQQQRRRSGEAERLRQLEVLAFRTRVRRTLEARAARLGARLADDLPA